jgi:hypothetical protein
MNSRSYSSPDGVIFEVRSDCPPQDLIGSKKNEQVSVVGERRIEFTAHECLEVHASELVGHRREWRWMNSQHG